MNDQENGGDVRPVSRFTLAERRWAYGITAAVLAILAGVLGWDAIVTEQWLTLTAAVLNLGGAATSTLAAANTKTPKRDTM